MIGVASVFLVLLQAAAPPRPGVVTGQLQTPQGAPAAAIRVSALPAPPPNILPSDGQNYYASTAPAGTTLSDAQGRYRLTNLAPGRYFIVASVFGYPTFYPSGTNADRATVVTIGADKPSEGVNFSVQMPAGGRVSGRVNTAAAPGVQEKAVLSGVALGELLESPIGSDGGFTFGHLPKGAYLLSLFPAVPGMPSRTFRVEESDVRVDLVRPTLRSVSGRIVVKSGPLPYGWLGFETVSSYETAHIDPDGTFRTQLQPARHKVELAGMPGGYSLSSVRLGNQDLTQGVTVGSSDVTGLVITVSPPTNLPKLRGKVTGVPAASLASAKVELTGHIVGAMEAAVKPDGTFEFPAVTPGSYRARVPQAAAIPSTIVVIGWEDTDVQLSPAAAR
jgi:Carboxypeptidase regulatory-like domain